MWNFQSRQISKFSDTLIHFRKPLFSFSYPIYINMATISLPHPTLQSHLLPLICSFPHFQIHLTQGARWKLVQLQRERQTVSSWSKNNTPKGIGLPWLNSPIYQIFLSRDLKTLPKKNCMVWRIQMRRSHLPQSTSLLTPILMNLLFLTSMSIFMRWR